MPESHFPIFKATAYIGGIRDAAGKQVAFRLRASIILLNMTRSPSVFRRGISSALGWVTFSLAIGVAGASILGAAKQQAPVVLRPSDTPEEIVHKAAQVVPAPRQVAWQKLEFVGFAHFGKNTFTNREGMVSGLEYLVFCRRRS